MSDKIFVKYHTKRENAIKDPTLTDASRVLMHLALRERYINHQHSAGACYHLGMVWSYILDGIGK